MVASYHEAPLKQQEELQYLSFWQSKLIRKVLKHQMCSLTQGILIKTLKEASVDPYKV